jgi:hypothetical protein
MRRTIAWNTSRLSFLSLRPVLPQGNNALAAGANRVRIEVLFYGKVDRILDLLTGRDISVPLDRAALELATIEFPTLEAGAFVAVLDAYAGELCRRLSNSRDGLVYVQEANRYLFDELGFRGNASDYYNPRNSCLNEVLTARTGIPITLSLVYIEIARRLEKPVQGIGLPGHFIVRTTTGCIQLSSIRFTAAGCSHRKNASRWRGRFHTSSWNLTPSGSPRWVSAISSCACCEILARPTLRAD